VRAGRGPAIKALARRSTLPVTLDIAALRRLPETVEVACIWWFETMAWGADSGKGSGLIGLKDRVAALGGQLAMSSPVGNGTSLSATVPLHQP